MTFGDFLSQLFPSLIAAGAVYAGIRADLARLNEIAMTARERADQAHERINSMLEK